MDNHESHMTIAGLDFCKNNNIEVLTLPPHTSHRLQPLDRGVFGPLKTYFDHSCKAWMLNHSGIPITIDRIAELVAEPLLKGASSMNIIAGFRSTSIWPFNREIFSEDDFTPAFVTDSPYEDEPDQEVGPSNAHEEPVLSNADQEPDRSNLDLLIRIEDIRPFPKAPLRKPSNRGRKRRKAALLTDAVMLESLRAEQAAAAQKKSDTEAKNQFAAERKKEREAAKRQKLIQKRQKLTKEKKKNELKKNS